jgi:hypothetical protein
MRIVARIDYSPANQGSEACDAFLRDDQDREKAKAKIKLKIKGRVQRQRS